jgi:NADH-quinone oxidoreductase subunit H
VPISLVWILLVAAIRTATLQVEDRRALLMVVAAVFFVVVVIFYLLPQPEPEQHPSEGSGLELLPLSEGGFPTPPLDLVVPPTPRSLTRVGAATAGPATSTVLPSPAPATPDEADRG